MTTTTPASMPAITSATLGHLALHYRPGDRERSRLLFECLGARLEDNGPPEFCSIVFDPAGWNYVDNVMYLSQAGAAKLALEEAITEGLHIGQADEDPRATAFRDLRVSSPEALDHVGIRYATFEELERAVLALADATAPGGLLEGRATVTKYRARAGQDPKIDQLMDTSPIFRDRDDDGTAFTDYGVQVFVRTDLCTTGLFALGQTFELDYYWAPAFDCMPDFGRGRRCTRVEQLGHGRGDPGTVEPEVGEERSRLPVGQVRGGRAERDRGWRRSLRLQRAERGREQRADAALGDAVLGGDHQAVRAGVGQHLRVGRDRADVPHGRTHVARFEQVGRFLGGLDQLADREEADLAAGPNTTRVPAVADRRVDGMTRRRLRPSERDRARGDAHSLLEHDRHLLVGGRREQREPGNLGEQREVVEAVMAGAIVAGDAGPVDAEHDRQRVQSHVVDQLVPRPAQEGGIDRHHRAEAAHRHPRSRGDRVLLGDPDVEAAVGEAGRERQEPGGAGHAGGERDDLRPGFGELDQRSAEGAGVRGAVGAHRHAGLGIERADVVEALLFVALRGEVPLALASEHVHDDGPAPRRRVAQHRLERGDVVPVDRPDVVEPERPEECRRIGAPDGGET